MVVGGTPLWEHTIPIYRNRELHVPTNILVVDDHRIYREAFCTLLSSCFTNIQIIQAVDGISVLNLTEKIPFDLIIMDYELTTVTGSTVVRRLRERGKPLPPIVLVSAHPDVAIYARLLLVPAYLHKPVSYDDIQRVIGPLLTTPSQSRNNLPTRATQRV